MDTNEIILMISNIEDIVGNYKKNISNIEIAENEDRE
jgi:hypothetical protein